VTAPHVSEALYVWADAGFRALAMLEGRLRFSEPGGFMHRAAVDAMAKKRAALRAEYAALPRTTEVRRCG
jgi:hypothetical protein